MYVCVTCYEKEIKRRNRSEILKERKLEIEKENKQLAELLDLLQKSLDSGDVDLEKQLRNEVDQLKEKIRQREIQDQSIKKKKKKTTVAKTTKPKKAANKVKVTSKEEINQMLEEKCTIPFERVFYEPTEGKKCLVLDLDKTLFDHTWQHQVREELKGEKDLIPEFKRPYLHEFLTTCYQKYDIIIWSATNINAIEYKCSNLGIFSHPDYRINLVISKEHMLFVNKMGKKYTFKESIKPLEVIWRNVPQYNEKNTIHIDDISSNFQLNPKNGLLIHPFKDASINSDDTELFFLAKYLLLIATNEDDFTGLNHSKWKEYTIKRLWEKQSDFSIPELVIETGRMKEIAKIYYENKENDKELSKSDDDKVKDNQNLESNCCDIITKESNDLNNIISNVEKEEESENDEEDVLSAFVQEFIIIEANKKN